jgi:O-antigen/teichoic acid export membrane protein
VNRLTRYIRSGHARTKKIKKNIVYIFLFRAPAILCELLIVRLTLEYLEPLRYGIWITLVSIVSWLSFSDLGLASGLRNKLAEAFARNDSDHARQLVSTTYLLMCGISICFVVILGIANTIVRWDWVLNTPESMRTELSYLAFWMIFFFSFYYVTNLIKAILKAGQQERYAVAIDLVTSILSLGVVWILLEWGSSSLLILGFLHSATLAIAPLFAAVLYFYFFNRALLPSYRYFKKECIRDVWSLGWKFLVIQFCSLIIFSTDSLIITRVLGPEYVTNYVVVYKYFNILTIAFAMILMPFWSAYTEAYAKSELDWIRRILTKQLYLLIPLALVTLSMVAAAGYVIESIWLGTDLDIEFSLFLFMGLYVILQAWNRIFGWFLNGTGMINITLLTMLIGALINVPVSVVFASYYGLGASGVILGTIVSLSFFAVFAPIKAMKILKTSV